MHFLLLLSSLFLNSYADSSNPALLTFEQLDQMILTTCAQQANKDECQKKLNHIRTGINEEELLAKAPKLPIDSEVKVEIIKNPSDFLAGYYCLAIFNQIISLDQIGPDIFPYVVYGLSYGDQSVNNYNKWLKSKDSQQCREKLKLIKLNPFSVSNSKKINIVLNPVTFLENGTNEDFLEIAAQNYNHERLHGIYSHEKLKNKMSRLWESLAIEEKTQFKLEHPSYNFKDENTLYREFFSYTFESSPMNAYNFLNNKDKKTYHQLQKNNCQWCLEDDLEIFEKFEKLSKLSPKDLLAKIEEDTKVLILSSGRKSPSQLFYWGKIREDKGELTHISKIEGAMGKALCKGEKPEAEGNATIILASDSPYSTLLHEYLHIIQIKRSPSWCPISKRLWTNPPQAFESRMVRDREWDVRLVLWKLLNSPQMNIEDHIIVADGILREARDRNTFDSRAKDFLKTNNVESYLIKKIDEYKALMKK